MDYLCELPNDAARRAALGSLPPDLNSTYERILSRVNQGNPETQMLVRRALRWIANDDGDSSLTVEALCEAVSIDLGSTRLNHEAIPDEFEILHRCSSLVRKSENGKKLELAHFTVKEFLQQIDPKRDISIGAYRYDPRSDKLILVKVCLTYLMFDNFDQSGPFSKQAVELRYQEYAFRQYAALNWDCLAHNCSDDTELFALIRKLFDPSKPNTFILWAQDIINDRNYDRHWDTEALSIINSGLAGVTPLHYAAVLQLGEVCDWLIGSGCDVNRNTVFGTPLHCALIGPRTYSRIFYHDLSNLLIQRQDLFSGGGNKVFTLLLDAGADPNGKYRTGTSKLSPLFMALYKRHWDLAVQLLDKGGRLDDTCMEILEYHSRSEDVAKLMEHAGSQNVVQGDRVRLFQLALRANTPNAACLVPKEKGLSFQNSLFEQNLRTAAEYGQVETVLGLLEDQSLDINAADETTGLTALHHAAKTDQLGVAQFLIDRGADLSRSDNLGWTALHHCVLSGETHCLQLFLQKGANTSDRDSQGMTVWHLAAQEDNLEALSVLSTTQTNSASFVGLKADDGRTALLYASGNGDVEAMSLLLTAGSNLNETDTDGCTPLHYAAMSGSSEAVEFLAKMARPSDEVTHDGSTALHYAVTESCIRILIRSGVDPRGARNDGFTPLHILVNMIKDRSNKSYGHDTYKLFAAGLALLQNILENSGSASDLSLGSELIYLASSSFLVRAHEVVLTLLEYRLDPNISFADGKTALMAAAERGYDDILGALLARGADPNIADDSGFNALHFAYFNGHKNILEVLRTTSIDWNKESAAEIMKAEWRKRVTPLHIAAQSNDSRVLEYLLNQGLTLNVDARTDKGETPLSVAVWQSTPKIVSLLLSKGVDTTVIDSYGQSAVHWAARNGFEEVIAEFIKHSSNLGLPNSLGLTPELVARKYGHETLAETIMDYVNEQSEFRRSALVVFGWVVNNT